MTEKYEVTATKKDGTTYHGLISISGLDGSWIYTAPDESSDIRYIPMVEEKSKE
jgi:VCBS repeat-containing protein